MRLHSEIQTDIKNFSAPEFDTTYDPVVRKSKGMQKTQEFDASYDPIVAQSKGMLKTPELVKDSALLHRLISKTKCSLK